MGSNQQNGISGAPDGVVFDYAGSLEQIGGDPELLETLIAAHLEQEGRLLQALDKAMHPPEATAIRKAAHALASSVSVLCAPRARAAAKYLEGLALRAELQGAEAAAQEIRNELRQLRQVLEQPGERRAA